MPASLPTSDQGPTTDDLTCVFPRVRGPIFLGTRPDCRLSSFFDVRPPDNHFLLESRSIPDARRHPRLDPTRASTPSLLLPVPASVPCRAPGLDCGFFTSRRPKTSAINTERCNWKRTKGNRTEDIPENCGLAGAIVSSHPIICRMHLFCCCICTCDLRPRMRCPKPMREKICCRIIAAPATSASHPSRSSVACPLARPLLSPGHRHGQHRQSPLQLVDRQSQLHAI